MLIRREEKNTRHFQKPACSTSIFKTLPLPLIKGKGIQGIGLQIRAGGAEIE